MRFTAVQNGELKPQSVIAHPQFLPTLRFPAQVPAGAKSFHSSCGLQHAKGSAVKLQQKKESPRQRADCPSPGAHEASFTVRVAACSRVAVFRRKILRKSAYDVASTSHSQHEPKDSMHYIVTTSVSWLGSFASNWVMATCL